AYSSLLKDGSTFQTIQGNNVTITVENGSTYVNDAKIIDRDFLTSNGVIHVIGGPIYYNKTSARPPLASTPSNSSSPTGLTPPQPSSGLSVGAKAGIAVGAVLASVAMVLAAIFIVRRARKSSDVQSDVQEKPPNIAPAELSPGNRYLISELEDSSRIAEMDGRQVTADARSPVEMEGITPVMSRG
ncbi:hypothetical protein LTR60_000443, partial [Cryomyces antarcticus]